MERTRVVVTGLGAVTVLGSSVAQFWDGLLAGRSGVRRITAFDASQMPCQIAGEIPDFNVDDYMEKKDARRVARSTQIALGAATQALKDAGLADPVPDAERTGIVFGTAIGGLERVSEAFHVLQERGVDRLNPFAVPSGIPNLSAYAIARRFQALGPNATITTACATGTQAVGEGAEFIRRGVADVVVTGGTEALIQDFAIGGFSAMRALPINYNDDPTHASRPFDAKREGFIFSEGAACLILESLEHAQKRGARIYAEFAGHASSSDGYDMAAPHPEGLGAIRCMRWALKDAGMQPEEIDYINSHGTSTPLNDSGETHSIKVVFGEHAYKLAVNSTKSMTGHAMGASGAIEAIACTLQLYNDVLHPTINYEFPDPECDLDYVPNVKRAQAIRTALSNSFGLGGQNACLVLKKYVG